MNETFVSFSLSSGRIHIPLDALIGLGRPKYVHFLFSSDGKLMVMEPYNRKVFASIQVPTGMYVKTEKRTKMDKKCLPLCRLLAKHLNWEDGGSYRIKGQIMPAQQLALFHLDDAVKTSISAQTNLGCEAPTNLPSPK